MVNLAITPKRLEAFQKEVDIFADDQNVFADSDDDETLAAGQDVGSCGWISLTALKGLVKKKTQFDCIASLRNQPKVWCIYVMC